MSSLSLTDLPLDIKTVIASNHQEAWIKLYLYDSQFSQYAKSHYARLMFIELFTDQNITTTSSTIVTEYRLFGKLHRINDLPAMEYNSGKKIWCYRGKLHRDNDLPAVIYSNGERHWYQNGKLHRDNDLPAMIYSDGTQHWYRYGKRHRDNDLPAVIFSDGNQLWYKHGIKYPFH